MGRGSTFSFEARFGIGDAEEMGDAALVGRCPLVTPAPRRPLRVLLVEDNEINQTIATQLLEKRGHQVTVADDGAGGPGDWRSASRSTWS